MLDEERIWTEENIDSVALKHFPNIDRQESLKRPILYSNWLTKVMYKMEVIIEIYSLSFLGVFTC